MPNIGFETFEHGADIGIRGYGPSLEEAFAQTAKAMFSLMWEDLQTISPKTEIMVKTNGFDLESLLVFWLNALLSQADIYKVILSKFEPEIKIEDYSLKSKVWGDVLNRGYEHLGIEVKGATFTQAKVYESKGKWIAQCVVDV